MKMSELKHNCVIRFTFGVGDIQQRHILITGGRVRAYDIDMDYLETHSCATVQAMYDKYCHYDQFEIVEWR